jgi:hypothetical protein
METALVALVALACPIGMGLCMWMMARGVRGGADKREADHSAQPSLAELRVERDRLNSEVERAERTEGSEAETVRSNDASIQRA